MSGNTFGRLFRLTTYGESHGPALGGVVDGCPAGIALSEELLQKELDRRRPGGGTAGTTRKEPDAVRLLSGVFEGATTGTPIGFQIENTNQRSGDYGPLAAVWRPGHADMTYDAKYGVRDFRGGGRSSARETAARVAGGAIARALLHDAPLMLLDEPTEGLDAATESQILHLLADVMRDKTVLMVTHRLRGLAGFNQIIVMDNGQIIEQGSHAELLAKQGRYFQFKQRL